MTEILQKENKILRQKSQTVAPEKIGSPEIRALIAKMKRALDSQPDGVALAAPQIGELLRIFIVSGKTLSWLKSKKVGAQAKFEKTVKTEPDQVFINPRLFKRSRQKEWMEEGCLSVRWLYGRVRRARQASVEAYNEQGRKIRFGASGLLAQIFQHEIDHLDGVLFSDKAKDLKEIKPSENSNHRR